MAQEAVAAGLLQGGIAFEGLGQVHSPSRSPEASVASVLGIRERMVSREVGQLEADPLASVERVLELVLERAAVQGLGRPALPLEAAAVAVRDLAQAAVAAENLDWDE